MKKYNFRYYDDYYNEYDDEYYEDYYYEGYTSINDDYTYYKKEFYNTEKEKRELSYYIRNNDIINFKNYLEYIYDNIYTTDLTDNIKTDIIDLCINKHNFLELFLKYIDNNNFINNNYQYYGFIPNKHIFKLLYKYNVLCIDHNNFYFYLNMMNNKMFKNISKNIKYYINDYILLDYILPNKKNYYYLKHLLNNKVIKFRDLFRILTCKNMTQYMIKIILKYINNNTHLVDLKFQKYNEKFNLNKYILKYTIKYNLFYIIKINYFDHKKYKLMYINPKILNV